MIWRLILAVFLGSGIGGVCRFVLSESMAPYLQVRSNPYPATLAVNVVGCLIIGLVYGAIDRGVQLSPEGKLFLTTGFCGGLTTFSTFVNEGVALINSGQVMEAMLYVLLSVVIGFGAAFFGLWLAGL